MRQQPIRSWVTVHWLKPPKKHFSHVSGWHLFQCSDYKLEHQDSSETFGFIWNLHFDSFCWLQLRQMINKHHHGNIASLITHWVSTVTSSTITNSTSNSLTVTSSGLESTFSHSRAGDFSYVHEFIYATYLTYDIYVTYFKPNHHPFLSQKATIWQC